MQKTVAIAQSRGATRFAARAAAHRFDRRRVPDRRQVRIPRRWKARVLPGFIVRFYQPLERLSRTLWNAKFRANNDIHGPIEMGRHR